MNAKKFFDRFIENATEERLFQYYRDDATFTPKILAIINEIIDGLGEGYHHQNEYFRIDAVGWTTRSSNFKDEAEVINMNPYVWDLKVAVEHENNMKDWSDEVIKLIHVKCPLKVIIGYNQWDKRDDKITGDTNKLKVIAKWMNEVDAFSKNSEEYLIIIGNCKAADRTSGKYEKFDYRGYVYDWKSQEFEKI